MNKRHTLLLYAASAICWVIQASATITLFEENFGGESSNLLSGTTPSSPTSSWTNDWEAAGSFKANGSSTTEAFEASALLAFSPIVDNVYTLEVTMSEPQGAGWAMFGFSQDNTTSNPLWENNPSKVGPIMLWRSNGSVESYLGGGEGDNPGLHDKETHTSVHDASMNFGIVIETRNTGVLNVEYFVNGISVRSEEVTTQHGHLNHVGLSQTESTTTQFTNFKLTQSSSIPEPGHYGLIIGFLALGCVLVCRRIPAI